jgi:hypothetical protein
MDENIQHGHLDADQLNAFVEHALPEPERVQTLAHLAVCADCRRVVALASDAAEVELAQFPAPAVAAPAARPWWRMPVWQWSVPLAAAGVLLFATLHRPQTNVAPPLEMAAKTVPVVPGAQPVAATPSSPAPQKAGAQIAEAKVAPSVPRIDPQAMEDLPMVARDIATMAAPPLPKLPAPMVAGAMGGSAPATGETAPRSAVVLGSASVTSPVTTAEQAAAPMPPPPPRPELQSATEQTGAALDALAAEPPMARQRQMAPAPQARPAAAAGKAAVSAMIAAHPLPSGLPVVSTVSSAGPMLAIDSANHVFVTTDGSHWEKVKEQWSGRAVRVALVGQMAGAGRAIASMNSFQNDAVAAAPRLAAAPERATGSSVTGVVTDPTGAFLPGATVTLLDAASKAAVRTTTADKNGRYTIAAAAGTYVLDGKMPGFSEGQVTISIPERTAFNQNLRLAVGYASQTVTVTASNADLQTLNATADETVNAAQVEQLPVRKSKKAEAEPVFELTTDAGERWVSVDGKKWVKR